MGILAFGFLTVAALCAALHYFVLVIQNTIVEFHKLEKTPELQILPFILLGSLVLGPPFAHERKFTLNYLGKGSWMVKCNGTLSAGSQLIYGLETSIKVQNGSWITFINLV